MRESTVISITNSKGGVGKTTTALNLGAALAAAKKRVLLIDNDPQGNLTAALGYTPGEQKNTLAKLVLVQIDSPEDLDLHLPRTVIHTETGIDLIPANKRLADAAARLQVMQLSQYNAAGFSDTLCEKIMDKLLGSLREQYDYIIIDCGLKHELLTINALAAADYCIIPVQAHFLASEGIPDVLEMVKNVQNRFNPNLKIAGILLTMYQSRPQLCQSVRNSVNDIYGESLHVFERPIEQTIKVAECPAAGMSILGYPEVDVEDPDMIMYDLLWAFFDEEPEETDDEFYTVRFSDQSIDRLYQLGCQDGDIFSSKFRMWQEKIKDIFLFYVVGASHSVFDVAYHFTGDGVKIDITLSPDCYEPILFLNSIINMILYGHSLPFFIIGI